MQHGPVDTDEFTCRIVTYAEELASIYICYSTGDRLNAHLSCCITSPYGQCVSVLAVESLVQYQVTLCIKLSL